MNYNDWALRISQANPNFNQAVFPNTQLPSDSHDYNYQMGYLNDPSGKLASNGHLGDIGKLPNHPTFSNESVYAVGNPNAGRWVPSIGAELNHFTPTNSYLSAKAQEDNAWRYHNPARGLFRAPEQDAYNPAFRAEPSSPWRTPYPQSMIHTLFSQ